MNGATRFRVEHASDERRSFPTSRAVPRSDKAYRCSCCKLVVILRDPEHHPFGRLITHLLGQDARFFSSLEPMLRAIEVRGNAHGPANPIKLTMQLIRLTDRRPAERWPVRRTTNLSAKGCRGCAKSFFATLGSRTAITDSPSLRSAVGSN